MINAKRLALESVLKGGRPWSNLPDDWVGNLFRRITPGMMPGTMREVPAPAPDIDQSMELRPPSPDVWPTSLPHAQQLLPPSAFEELMRQEASKLPALAPEPQPPTATEADMRGAGYRLFNEPAAPQDKYGVIRELLMRQLGDPGSVRHGR